MYNRFRLIVCRYVLPILMLSTFFQVAAVAQTQPSLSSIRATTVSLKLVKWAFSSGLTENDRGYFDGNGTGIVRYGSGGSGFLVREDGTIATNYHVVQRCMEAEAIFDGGARYSISFIKVYDKVNDLAILQLDSDQGFPIAQMEDSDAVNVMDRVYAAGNTLGEGLSVTEGMVNRIIPDVYGRRRLIRHSAPIAPGNSGGPLYRGDKVVGINVLTVPPYEIHYAVPANLLALLLANPEYDRRFLFRDAFPTTPAALLEKLTQQFARNGQVPAARNDQAGSWTIEVALGQLVDLAIVLNAEQGKDLAVAVTNAQGEYMGYGDDRGTNVDVLFISTENRQPAYITVLNHHNTPVNFGLSVHEISW